MAIDLRDRGGGKDGGAGVLNRGVDEGEEFFLEELAGGIDVGGGGGLKRGRIPPIYGAGAEAFLFLFPLSEFGRDEDEGACIVRLLLLR